MECKVARLSRFVVVGTRGLHQWINLAPESFPSHYLAQSPMDTQARDLSLVLIVSTLGSQSRRVYHGTTDHRQRSQRRLIISPEAREKSRITVLSCDGFNCLADLHNGSGSMTHTQTVVMVRSCPPFSVVLVICVSGVRLHMIIPALNRKALLLP